MRGLQLYWLPGVICCLDNCSGEQVSLPPEVVELNLLRFLPISCSTMYMVGYSAGSQVSGGIAIRAFRLRARLNGQARSETDKS